MAAVWHGLPLLSPDLLSNSSPSMPLGNCWRQIKRNETHLGHTDCPPSPPRTRTAMPSHRSRAGSRGRARTGHSSLLATRVCTWRRRGEKMEQPWTINTPPTVLCSTAPVPTVAAFLVVHLLEQKVWLCVWLIGGIPQIASVMEHSHFN